MKKKIIYITILAVLLGLFFYISRGPDISNALKRVILPELELVTGKKFIVQKVYLNLFPLFVGMKDIKAFDEQGNRLFLAERVKGYLSISGLLKREIILRRLVIKNMEIDQSREQTEEIIKNVKKYMAEETMALKVIVKSIDIKNAALAIRDRDSSISMKGIDSDIVFSPISKFRVFSKDVSLTAKNIPELHGSLETYFLLKDKEIELKSLKIESLNSEIKSSGIFSLEKLSGEFHSEARIAVKTIKDIFNLKNRPKNMEVGEITAKGSIKIDGLESLKDISLDLKLKGNLYLETLMELLSVKEKLKGFMHFEGNLKGYLNDLQGSARAQLEKGNLFGVEIDRLNCNVTYRNSEMRFIDGKARLYGGTAHAEAMIRLPVVNYYSFMVSAKDVSSKGVFKLIEWDPGIPEGKVTGEIASSGSSFSPAGKFAYRSAAAGTDLLGRIQDIKGEFVMKDEVIHFANMSISSDKSSASTSGNVDLANKRLHFTGSGKSADVKDFTSPYFTALSGQGDFHYTATGIFDDPAVDLKLTSSKMAFSTGELGMPEVLKSRVINLNMVDGLLSYRKNLLNLKKLSALSQKEEFTAAGAVNFKKAQTLFDLKEPDYDLNISVRHMDAKTLSGTFQDAPQIEGNMGLDFRLQGKPEDIKADGRFHIRDLIFDGRFFVESASGRASYAKRIFSFDDLKIKQAGSVFNLNGQIMPDKRLSFTAEGQKINIGDFISEGLRIKDERLNLLRTFSLTDPKIKGEGTLEDPVIEIKSEIQGGAFRGVALGKGNISGILRNKRFDINASLLDKKVNINGSANLTDKLPWSLNIDLQPARYEFLLAGLLKEIPEDLIFNLTGNITAQGDRSRLSASAVVKRAHLYLYGIGFTNSSDILLSLEDKRLSVKAFSMKSDDAEIRLRGGMLIGKNFDIHLEGSSSLAPLKAISRNIDAIRGDAAFLFSVAGDWDKPRINGKMNVKNGTLGIRDLRHRLTSVEAAIYVDNDRIVIEKAGGKAAGGDITVSGNLYLERFSLKRFSLEAKLKGINTGITKDFWSGFDGNLYYRGTPESQTITGEINVRNARYSEKVEWKGWILKARLKERPKIETWIDRTNLNIRIAGTNLLIDNNIARVPVNVDTFVRGSVGRPVLIGRMESREGTVYFRNNEFKVLKANVDFSDPAVINPYFDIIAETSVSNYNIRLKLDGYMEQFNLTLTSNPSLPETDIFSLLTMGQVGKHLKGLEGGIGAGEATSFLAGKLQDVLEERLKTVTGFDRIQVDPHISKSTAAITPRVTVAKRLLGDKLHVTYSASVGTGEEQVWKLEYAFEKNLSLVGIRDERGGIGGDIKFRFEFK